MGRDKDRMIEQMEYERERTESAVGDIESYGDRFKWLCLYLNQSIRSSLRETALKDTAKKRLVP